MPQLLSGHFHKALSGPRLSSRTFCASTLGSAVVIALVMLHIIPATGQALRPTEAAITSAQQDPAALALLQKALTLMGGSRWASLSDFTLIGVVHGVGDDDGAKGSAISLLGTPKGRFRVEEAKDGLPVRAVAFDGQHGQRTVSSDASKPVPLHAILGMPPLFPLPTLSSALTSRNMAIIDRGSTQWDGVAARVVESRTILPSHASLGSPMNRLTPKLFYIDSASGQLLGISFRSFSLANSNAFVESSVHYSDFSSEHGIAYPHTVVEYVNRQPMRRIAFTSLEINRGLDDSHFHF